MTCTHGEQGRLTSTPAGAPAAFTVRWEISPLALTRSPRGSAALNGHAARLRQAWLEWSVGEESASAALVLEMAGGGGTGGAGRSGAGGEIDRIALEGLQGVAVRREHDGEWTHIDADGALLTVSLHGERLVYARTGVLGGTLDLRGGVYDGPRGSAGSGEVTK